ncbi:MAG: MFS transporter [Mariprofundaceae bacterium]|nr:MFS transporter [Mariprofundaceae bacterium]
MMHRLVGTRLSVMMFLQFFVWGAWYVTVGNYMKTIQMSEAIDWAYTVGPLAAILSPFFLGMVADRFFATERVLAVMHILGGVAIFLAPEATQWRLSGPSVLLGALNLLGLRPEHAPFIGVLFLHMLFYMPTLGLTNTLAFHNLVDRERQFPIVRVFGTLGWIAANIVVSRILHADETALPLQIAGGAAVLLGLYSLTLPHTPPPAAGKEVSVREILGLDSLALMKEPSFAVFITSSLLICIPLAAYYAYAPVFVREAGLKDPAFKMSFGQMSEVFFMVAMPLFFARLGVKKMLLVGMLAWVLRYILFGFGAGNHVFWMITGGIVLHGICYDFFFVTGFIYVDRKASAEIRGQAQGFLVLVTQGIGLALGAQFAGGLIAELTTQKAEVSVVDWYNFWMVCAFGAALVAAAFALLFEDDVPKEEPAPVGEAEVAV